jgi:O-antigen/teichoic acid export membrane protein
LWSLVWSPLIVAFDRLPMFMFTTLASGAMNVGMNILLIPRYGAVGSGWATVLSLATSCMAAEFLTWLRGGDFPHRGWRLYAPPVVTCAIALAISSRIG